MKRLWLALAGLLWLACAAPAHAQNARVVTDCTVSIALPTRDATALMVDQFGRLCTTGASSGGGSSTVTGSMEQDVRSSGTLSATSTSSTLDIPINGQSTVGLRFSGLAASGATVSYLQSNDGGATFTGVSEVNTATGVTSLTRTTDGQVRVAVQGRTLLRLQVTTAGTGTISVAWNVSVREGLVSLASPIPPGGNTIGSVSAGTDGAADRKLRTTTTGVLEPPTADTGKIVATSVSLTANTSTQLVASNSARIAVEIQCDGAAVVGISRTGATLTSATAAPLVIPAGSYPLYTMPIATLTAITAYTATAQTCRVTEYLR